MHGHPLSSRVVLLTGATLDTANEYRTSAESGSTLARLAAREAPVALDELAPVPNDKDGHDRRRPRCFLRDYDNIVFFIMTQPGLGEFEQLVLLAIAHLDGNAYGIPIVEEIERRTGRTVARAAVYITLRRLEEKGFISTWIGDAIPERGGKGRRYAKLEANGAKALRDSRNAAERMWQGLDPASLRTR